jgi:hypothetical protein
VKSFGSSISEWVGLGVFDGLVLLRTNSLGPEACKTASAGTLGPFYLGARDLRAGQGGANKFPIDRVDDGQHDRTPLFDPVSIHQASVSSRLRWVRKMVSSPIIDLAMTARP